MRRHVDHSALKIAGFVEPWAAPPGTKRQVSLSVAEPVDAVRLRRLDRDELPEIPWAITSLAEPATQRIFPQGGFARLDRSALAPLGGLASLRFEVKLTRNPGERTLLDAGAFQLRLADGALIVGASTLPLPSDRWLVLHLDFQKNTLSITGLDSFRPFSAQLALPVAQPEELVFLSDAAETELTVNARLARPALETRDGRRAEWRFPTLFSREPLLSQGLALALEICGNPTFCVTSARHTGESLDPRGAAEHYDAIHFHDTDMAALDWPPSHSIDVPKEAESGVYAIEIESGGVTERIPFFVSSAKPSSRLAFLVPSTTYLAYADEYLPPHLYEWFGTDRGHLFARDNQLRSLYDYHRDGGGVSLVSTRKPKATLRDDYRYPLCGDPHNLPVDLHFLRFCAREGIALDLLTDQDLHRAGAPLLKPYKAVITGSHPEYLSVEMDQAWRDYVATGGRLAYLGGNGFAAAVAWQDDLLELRRGPTQAGRTWDGPQAEMHLALTNRPAGYLRDQGRGEFSLTGVGISLMGFVEGRPFQRAEASYSAEFAPLFAGVAASFGQGGIVLGAAAGYEVDALSYALGSPADLVVLATASGFSADYVDDPNRWYEGGAPERAAYRRADMTYWRHPSGGAIFSASSVAFLGALPGPGADNDVARLVRNLLAHFSN